MKKYTVYILSLLVLLSGCTAETAGSSASENTPIPESTPVQNSETAGLPDITEMFTERDLKQTADLSGAEYITVTDNQEITITRAGVYVLSGNAKEARIIVQAGDEDKVQLVLDGLSLTNTDMPCIYIVNADKVFITTADNENILTVTGEFRQDSEDIEAVIYAKDDLVLNGTGTLTIRSSDNAVVCNDTLKITGGSYIITAEDAAFEAKDAILVYDGNITVLDCDDGLHAENTKDDTLGYIYIRDGQIMISGSDDAIHGTSIVRIDGGEITLTAAEGIEGTYIEISGGELNISAADDGINAGRKSSAYTPTILINGGTVTIVAGQGDTDGIDANGNIIMNGGTLDIKAQNPVDYDGYAELNGGTLILNGENVQAFPAQ